MFIQGALPSTSGIISREYTTGELANGMTNLRLIISWKLKPSELCHVCPKPHVVVPSKRACRRACRDSRRVPRAGALHGDAIAARAVSGGILNRIDRVWISCGSHPELSLILVG